MWCKHYKGGEDVCAKGIHLHDLFFDSGGRTFINHMPCFMRNKGKADLIKCEHCLYPTAEELAERDRVIASASQNAETVAREIDRIQARFGGTGGYFSCPICKTGSVRWRKASNGHRSAACSTADCVRFIE